MVNRLEIIFEDSDILVCKKDIGLSSEDVMPKLIREYLNDSEHYIGTVHRLDTAVGGIMVYAKTKTAARELSKQIQNGTFKKYYYTVINGTPEQQCGTYCDLLFKDSKTNKSFVVKRERKGVRKAVLNYTVLNTVIYNSKTVSLLEIQLDTGRSHQIRVQLSTRKIPILGDGKYGSREKCDIALFSHKIEFIHPKTNKFISFCAIPDNKYPFNIFNI